jgi:DNA-binding transcriptional ArsR family regulator
MWFDVTPSLFALAGQGTTNAALPSEPQNRNPSKVAEVAEVAEVAGPRDAILAAIRAGNRRPEPIATATKLGATAVYQELDRMRAAGLVTVSRDGTIAAGEQIRPLATIQYLNPSLAPCLRRAHHART